jgi:hypothetical protein
MAYMKNNAIKLLMELYASVKLIFSAFVLFLIRMKKLDAERSPREIVKELVSKYISAKPKRISLRLYWDKKHSLININGNNLNQKVEYSQTIDFISFGHGVVEAYKVYGELKEIPVSFRETVYRNEKVVLDLYPTGSAGIFDIFIDYKWDNKTENYNIIFS